MKKTSQYKKGVKEVVLRARECNPQIGNYLDHRSSDTDHFQVRLSNGSIKLPRQVAHSQEVFPPHVPDSWIIEIANTFELQQLQTQLQEPKNLIEKLLLRFKSNT